MIACKKATLDVCVYIFNIIIFFCGATMLGLGIWASLNHAGLQELMNATMYAAVYILIACGGLVMLTAFLGCYACANASKRAVVVYCIFVMLAIALKIAGCIVLFVFYLNASATLRSGYLNDYPDDEQVKKDWNTAQKYGECCGMDGYWDWEKSVYFNRTDNFPATCCKMDIEKLNYTNLAECQRGNSNYIHVEGCETMLRLYYYALGATTIVVILIELIAVVLIVSLYQHYP